MCVCGGGDRAAPDEQIAVNRIVWPGWQAPLATHLEEEEEEEEYEINNSFLSICFNIETPLSTRAGSTAKVLSQVSLQVLS